MGVAVERDASGSAFGKQLKRAQRAGAAWVAVIGEEEVAKGQLRLKRLADTAGAAAGTSAAQPVPDTLFSLEDPQAVVRALR
jgi:histidyl-tRNA synthetase